MPLCLKVVTLPHTRTSRTQSGRTCDAVNRASTSAAKARRRLPVLRWALVKRTTCHIVLIWGYGARHNVNKFLFSCHVQLLQSRNGMRLAGEKSWKSHRWHRPNGSVKEVLEDGNLDSHDSQTEP